MKRFCEYTIPDVNTCFSTIEDVYIFLDYESQNRVVDIELCRKEQTSAFERPGSNHGLHYVSNLLEDAFDQIDESGNPCLKRSKREHIINFLIRRNVYIPVMDKEIYPQLNLCEMEFKERFPFYQVYFNMANKIATLYSAWEFENLKIPKAKIPDNFQKGDIIPLPRYKPEHYMKLYLDNNKYGRPSITMLKGIIRYHLIKQRPRANGPKKTDFNDLVQMVRQIEQRGNKMTQNEIEKSLGVSQWIAKKIKKKLKSDKELIL